MSAARYHLVCEGFRNATVHKTQLSLALKQQLKLDDAQLADLMAGRRTVLARNLDETKARGLGQKLSRAGLKVKAETAAAHQKISPEELRHHLMDGGLSHYFAGRYHHPDEELETGLSLALLVAVPALCVIVLPLIALLLVVPLLSISVWLSQPIAAAVQGLIAASLLTPLWWLRPVADRAEGILLEPDTEPLLFALCDEISHYLDAPSVIKIHLSEAPLIRMHQSTFQWLRGHCVLEIGLPYLESTTVQQTAGEIAFQLGEMSTRKYYWQWGSFRLAYRALTQRLPISRGYLDNWIQPMFEHQVQRQRTMVEALIGRQSERELHSIRNHLKPIMNQWPEFSQFGQQLSIHPEHWPAWIKRASKPAAETESEDSPGLFRFTAPATWTLSNAAGYRKTLNHDRKDRQRIDAGTAWKHFLHIRRARQRLHQNGSFPVSALAPPIGERSSRAFRSTRLRQRYTAMLKAQEANIRHALGLQEKPPKQNLEALSRAWRDASAPYWDDSAWRHRNLPLAKAVYQALNQAEQIALWARQDVDAQSPARKRRDQQLLALFHRWVKTLKSIPALPMLGVSGNNLETQLVTPALPSDVRDAAAIADHCDAWVNSLQIYWTVVAASLLNSQADEETGQAAA